MAKQTDSDSMLQKPWGEAGPSEALDQLAQLAAQFMSAAVERSPDRSSFQINPDHSAAGPGIEELYGRITAANTLEIKVRLVTLPGGIRVGDNFVKCLLETFKDYQLADPPHTRDSADRGIWLEFQGKAAPLGPSRENAFVKRLETLNDMAKKLQANIPVVSSTSDLDRIYKDHLEYLSPVYPWQMDTARGFTKIRYWAQSNVDFLTGHCSLALVSPYPVLTDFGLALMANVFLEHGTSLGRFVQTQLTPQVLLEAAANAPGAIAAEVNKLTLGTNLYNMSSEVRSMFSSLNTIGKAVIFSGTYEELQTALSGGQGAKSEPLEPVVRHIPDIPLKMLASFAVQTGGRRHGGLSPADEQKRVEEVCRVLAKDSPAEQYRLLPNLVAHSMGNHRVGQAGNRVPLPAFHKQLKATTETLGGLGRQPIIERAPHVQEHFLKVLDDPATLEYLKARILGQDKALEEVVARLLDQVNNEELHKPLCYLAEGTTGTGKSECARLLSEALNIPLKAIDGASMGSPTMANSKLHGSSPGFVGSYEAGILEKMAKEHLGVVVEVMDLDHAPLENRENLAAEFLQIIGEGRAESGKGTTFSCANIVFIFTTNLPEGRDEKLRRPIGIRRKPSEEDVQAEVIKEVKSMFSPAFTGRIGDPILFEDLSDETLARILERALISAIRTTADRYGEAIKDVHLQKGLGRAMVSSSRLARAVLGARSFIKLGRSLGARAFRILRRSGAGLDGKNLLVSQNEAGELSIDIATSERS